jgi:Sensors of blue-light using FAD
MPYQIFYSSQATADMSIADLEQILVDARAGNEARNVTGVLVFVDGVFLQILEGEKDTVVCLMSSIAADSRHRTVKVFHEAEIGERTFGNWRMAYLNANAEQLSTWLGLPGTATIESVLNDIDRDHDRASQFARGILRALGT